MCCCGFNVWRLGSAPGRVEGGAKAKAKTRPKAGAKAAAKVHAKAKAKRGGSNNKKRGGFNFKSRYDEEETDSEMNNLAVDEDFEAEIARERAEREAEITREKAEKEAELARQKAEKEEKETPMEFFQKSMNLLGSITEKKRDVALLAKWEQNEDGTITGIVAKKKGFRDGAKITTSPIKGEAKAGKVVETLGGSYYRLL